MRSALLRCMLLSIGFVIILNILSTYVFLITDNVSEFKVPVWWSKTSCVLL